jgi:hypothetical protein
MRFASAFRHRFVVAAESQTVQRTAVEPSVDPVAQAGARWGRPAAFDIAARARASDASAGFSVSWIDNARVFKGTESHREYNHAPASVSGATLAPEGIRSVSFDCGTRKERRDVGGVIFTNLIRDYVKLDFPFGVEGSRGQPHPPPTPEEDLDESYGG